MAGNLDAIRSLTAGNPGLEPILRKISDGLDAMVRAETEEAVRRAEEDVEAGISRLCSQLTTQLQRYARGRRTVAQQD